MEAPRKFLWEVKKYIERMERSAEWEFGNCRSLEEMIAADDMPQLYYETCKLLKIPPVPEQK